MDKYKGQLGKAQVQIEHQQADYKSLEQKFLSVKSQSEQLSEKQKELSAVIDTLSQEKSNMNAENEKLKNEVEQLKKIKADAEKAKQAKQEQVKSAEKKSSSSSTVSAGGYENWRKINVQATAYSTYEAGDKLAGQWQGLTATGTSVRWGVIAVDPSVIPLGSKVYIPQFNQTFIAEDTGNAIKGNIIDIFMSTNSQANDWGRRNIEVYVQP
ncbi:3D domain-containing protein [Bacillus paranthracis]|uniref:3D domain-containing protein n=1 Tax=Bacillus paranthracis TaxID=2026186 RepID=UPI0029C3A95E|nr:3D domain-containing protein [Bacillus paranthracis]MDX6046691.1 3D domain-containing protein [Bacillus paranthracis]